MIATLEDPDARSELISKLQVPPAGVGRGRSGLRWGRLALERPGAVLAVGVVALIVAGAVLLALAAAMLLWGAGRGLFPLWLGLLVFSPFLVDATWTLLRRLAPEA